MAEAVERRLKKRKLDHADFPASDSTIKNADQLEQILRFQQDPSAAKQGKLDFDHCRRRLTQRSGQHVQRLLDIFIGF